jgi:hypothetical protein
MAYSLQRFPEQEISMNSKELTFKLRQIMTKKPLDILLYAIFALALFKLFDLYGSINEDEGNWDEFKTSHHCQLKRSGDSNIQSTWECDDGKTYYRWRQLKS